MNILKDLKKATLAVGLLGAATFVVPSWAIAGLSGRILIAGYGPELPVMQDMAKAFEKANPGTAIDIEWDRNVKAVEMVKSAEAQIAVTDHSVPDLKAVPIAWDGIAVIVNSSNPIKEVTKEQVRELLIGKLTRWSDLDGADTKVEVIERAMDQNLTVGLYQSLSIMERHPPTRTVRSDQKALSAVSGKDSVVTYVSLATALKAQEDGVPIRVLLVDKVEPGEPTVKDGRYPLRRPVILLTGKQPNPLTEAFVSFAQSLEGQRIVETMFVPYSPAPAEPKHAQSSSAG
jgi:phosphate transport system substrate-binding protein